MPKYFWLLAVGLFSCTPFNYSGQGNDVPTAGELEIWTDHGDSLLVSQFEAMFESNYPKSDIRVKYASETQILAAVNEGKCKACILHRDFDTIERTTLENRGFKVRSALIAKTSIALLSHRENPVQTISREQLRQILEGRLSSWQTLGGQGPITPVFDQAGGSNYLYFFKNWLKSDPKALKAVSSLNSPSLVIGWVGSHRDALGFINVNWISDRGDPASENFLKKVNVLKVEGDSASGYHYPFQSQIAARQYPFVLPVYIHDLQGYSGLASGFTAWICSQPGQVMVKKCGLLPARDFGRTVEFGTE